MFRQMMIVPYANKLSEDLGLTKAFRVVSVPEGLREADRMLCDMIRVVVSGKTGNAKYRIRYRDIKKWGYQSLVTRWYRELSEKGPAEYPAGMEAPREFRPQKALRNR